MKTSKNTEARTNTPEFNTQYNIKVLSARVIKDDGVNQRVGFSMAVNGIIINDCIVVAGEKAGEKYEFISLPKREYTNREGNKAYARIVVFPVEEYQTAIIEQVEKLLTE